MNTAMKFVSDTGGVKYPHLMQQSVSKIYELALLDDDDLKDLDEGKPVADIDVDEVDRMTVRDLRKKVREARKEREALENVIKSKSEKLDELEKEIALKEQASSDEEEKRYVPQPEDVNALRNEITLLATDSYDLYQRMVSLANRPVPAAIWQTAHTAFFSASSKELPHRSQKRWRGPWNMSRAGCRNL